MRRRTALLAIVMSVVWINGCAKPKPPPKPGPPPLKVSFRKTQIPAQGMVANVNNPSSSDSINVTVVFVVGKKEKEERSYRLDHTVKPHDSLLVGWAELGGWKLKAGDKLRIRTDEYVDDFECEVSN